MFKNNATRVGSNNVQSRLRNENEDKKVAAYDIIIIDIRINDKDRVVGTELNTSDLESNLEDYKQFMSFTLQVLLNINKIPFNI